MDRRDFLKTLGVAAAATLIPTLPKTVRPARAEIAGCRIVVFGADGLRVDYAQTLRSQGGPALSSSSLNPPTCATCGGVSMTQPGWAAIWSALPAEMNRCWDNAKYRKMRPGHHVMEKIISEYTGDDLYSVWIVGKGNIVGNKLKPSGLKYRKGSHYGVYEKIVVEGKQGVYYGDESRDNDTVYGLAHDALTEAVRHDDFICFVQFHDPDKHGHWAVKNESDDYGAYMQRAWEVDSHIANLMALLPSDTNVIYCSDHGFDFKSQGDTRNNHGYSPYGVLATNFTMLDAPFVSQMSIGRLIYKLAGGDPNRTQRSPDRRFYRMFGEDLI